ncbi:sugar transferase [Mycolicibacterium litorale]|uniref:Polyprenyl glycosylphosphotransferase n=2 Tax=Mycolicibacterium litorale TaxID=758802 RepID=A0AAD1IQF3_9MYCO|nr:sugar transferase [Mycolicibacterium litorale]TDY06501.1 exopolysaccharide biosynthesis polyprenyl glycosylphosphotransferase [Mycolicibacterium litorale]BBY19354.1 polyprenyl glycosylphosphotransferase [Mycolicibacterium litorale]
MIEREATAVVDRPTTGHPGQDGSDGSLSALPDGEGRTTTELDAVPGDVTTAASTSSLPARLRWQRTYIATLRISDAIVVCAAVLAAQYVSSTHHPTRHSLLTGGLVAAVWLLGLVCFHARSSTVIGTGLEEYRRLLAASIGVFGAIAMLSLVLSLDIPPDYVIVALPAGILGLLSSRWLWRRHVARERARGKYQTCVLAVGVGDAVVDLASELHRDPEAGYRVVAVAIPGYGPPRGEHLEIADWAVPVIGGETYILDALATCGADTVAIAGAEHFGTRGIRRLMWDLESMGIDLMLSSGVVDVAVSRLVMRPVAGLPVLHVEKPQYRRATVFCKRAFDICFATAALAISLPILLAAAIAIKIDSRGPVLYRSERIGIDGKPFSMLKLRTMVVDAESQLIHLLDKNENNGPMFKIREDPRVTSVGRSLRRFSVDELPQFVNVLRREMSVVGPRPPLRCEVDTYDSDVRRRLRVDPGITGLWQVSGRSDLSWEESVRLDLWYVDNWSLVEDILIIAKTMRAVFTRSGAY